MYVTFDKDNVKFIHVKGVYSSCNVTTKQKYLVNGYIASLYTSIKNDNPQLSQIKNIQ